MEKKIIVMIFEEDKVPVADWTSLIILKSDQHDKAYELLC